jgi:molybdenum cofactor cytidylyltransferase
MRRITGILLAAGAARRFGSNKLLTPLADGTPLGVRAARTLRAVSAETIAVVRSAEEPLLPWLRDEGLRCIVCPDAAEGMGASLRCGVSAGANADAWLIALADMPFIETDSIRAVVAALEQGAVLAAPFHDGRRGHPVGFSARFREPLLALAGDRGAREMVEAHAPLLTRVLVNDPGVLRDVDRPADLDVSATRAAG